MRDAVAQAAPTAERAHRGRRLASVSQVERAPHLSDRALQASARSLRLPREAVHGIRPACAHRLPGRRRGDVSHAHAGALRAAFHRAVGFLAVPAGRGHRLPVLAAEYRERVSAVGHDAVRADVGRVRAYFDKMRGYGIVESMKDFYWDIRPKPEYGTVEIRVFDTPLTVERAARIAAYAQSLARYLLVDRPLCAVARRLHALQLQPVPGVPLRAGRRPCRRLHAAASQPCARSCSIRCSSSRRHAASAGQRRGARASSRPK